MSFIASATPDRRPCGGGLRPRRSRRHKRHRRAFNPLVLDVQILSFNDFHGNLEPPSGSSGRDPRRPHARRHDADVTSAVDVTRTPVESSTSRRTSRGAEGHANTLTVAAGDMIGASPLLSAAFHDEPTIESMNKLGLDSGGGQPRVRRGLPGAAASAERRLHRRRRRSQQPELLRRPRLPGRRLPVPRGQRGQEGDRQDDPAALHDQERRTAPTSASSA